MKMFALFLYFCKPASKPLTINVICGFIFLLLDLLQFKPWYIKGLIVSIQFNTRCTDPAFPSLFSDPVVKLWSSQKFPLLEMTIGFQFSWRVGSRIVRLLEVHWNAGTTCESNILQLSNGIDVFAPTHTATPIQIHRCNTEHNALQRETKSRCNVMCWYFASKSPFYLNTVLGMGVLT